MKKWALVTCAIGSMTASALADPFDNEMWFRGAPAHHRLEFMQRLYDRIEKPEQRAQPTELGAYGNVDPQAPKVVPPRDVHGRFILTGPLSATDGYLNAAGDAMGISVITPNGPLMIDEGKVTRLASDLHAPNYAAPRQPVQVVMTERDIKAAKAIELFFADLDADQPKSLQGRFMSLTRVESTTGGIARLMAVIENASGEKIQVVIASQDVIDTQGIRLGDEVTLETDQRVVDGQRLLFAVNLKPAAVAAAAQRN